MLHYLNALGCLVEPGIVLSKPEVIRRYRLLKSFNTVLLQIIYMVQFSMLGKSEKGELFVV